MRPGTSMPCIAVHCRRAAVTSVLDPGTCSMLNVSQRSTRTLGALAVALRPFPRGMGGPPMPVMVVVVVLLLPVRLSERARC